MRTNGQTGQRKKYGAPPKRTLDPKVGRPSLGRRFALGLRITPDMKRRLDAATEESGRSQSQEVEMRLERSFRDEWLLEEFAKLLATAAR